MAVTMEDSVFWDVTPCGFQLLVTTNVVSSTLILFSLMIEATRRFLQEPHGVESQKTAFLDKILYEEQCENNTKYRKQIFAAFFSC
jgi:hypothetical protein